MFCFREPIASCIGSKSVPSVQCCLSFYLFCRWDSRRELASFGLFVWWRQETRARIQKNYLSQSHTWASMILAGGGAEFSPVLGAQQCGFCSARTWLCATLLCYPQLFQKKVPEAEMYWDVINSKKNMKHNFQSMKILWKLTNILQSWLIFILNVSF